MNDWVQMESYWINNSPQLSERWFQVRTARVTGSTVNAFLGRSRFSTSEDTINRMLGKKDNKVTNIMARGIRLEPNARRWLERIIGKNIVEIGLCVPKWDYRIGASVDGMIDPETICEIKIPNNMYKPLIYHRDKIQKGVHFDRYYHRHIWDSHYDQMQLGMAVLNAKYCYYTVYLPSSNEDEPEDYYVEKVPFNKSYWIEMYKEITEKYDSLLLPRMKELNIVRIDP